MHKLDIERMEELDAEINKKVSSLTFEKNGCFGTLLRAYPDNTCKVCGHFAECGDKMEAHRSEMMASAEEEVRKIVLEYELRTAKPVAQVAQVAQESQTPRKIDIVMADVESVDIRVAHYDEILGEKTKTKFDWSGVATLILLKKEPDFKAIRQICLSHVPDAYWDAPTGYGNANKLNQQMQNDGLIRWNGQLNVIEYL